MDKRFSYALTFVAADSAGLISHAAKVLFDNGFNISDSSSTLLQNVFSMIFIVSSEKDHSEEDVRLMFKSSGFALSVYKIVSEMKSLEGDHYSISVYGADKPGIVYAITNVLSKHNINIHELQTKETGKKESLVYIMMLEAVIPPELSEDVWTAELKNIAKSIGTDVTCHRIDSYEM